jgi:hypothetical protein
VYAPLGAIVLLSALQGTGKSPSLNNSSTKREFSDWDLVEKVCFNLFEKVFWVCF